MQVNMNKVAIEILQASVLTQTEYTRWDRKK